MLRNLVIVGNSSAARECYWLFREVLQAESGIAFKGFLSFEGYADNLEDLSALALGIDDSYIPKPNDIFIIAIGDPGVRGKAYSKWKTRGATFVNLIHPQVVIPDSTDQGEGNIIAKGSYISCNCRLGVNNYCNTFVNIGHDTQLGSNNFLGPFTCFLGNCRIGDSNVFGYHSCLLPNAKMGNENVIAPGSILYKGCRDRCIMSGVPALKVGSVA